MKLHVMSDLHFDLMQPERYAEFWGLLEAHVQADHPDAVILAGDIGNLRDLKFIDYQAAMKRFASMYAEVVVIPGNHEYWGTTILDGNQKLASLGIKGVHALRPGISLAIGGPGGSLVNGGTLWFPDCKDRWLKKSWCDYRFVSDAEPEIHAQHDLFKEHVLAAPGTIVVSHHFPTEESIAPEFAGENSNIFFNADIEDELAAMKAQGIHPPWMWIHGHTHNPFDYKSKYGFRVFCNPLGYTFEGRNREFWNRILVDTEDQGWYLRTFNGGSNDD